MSTDRVALRHISRIIVTGFYLGKIPYAPGTWGSALGLLLGYILLKYGPVLWFFSAILLIFFAGLLLIPKYAENYKKSLDDGSIVIDEVLGMLISMAPLGMTLLEVEAGDQNYSLNLLSLLPPSAALPWLLYIFCLFRLFDIWKPFPINRVDRNMDSALGTMLDDILAGILAALVYWVTLLAIAQV